MPRTDPHLSTARAVAREIRKRVMAAVRKRPKAKRLELAKLVRDELTKAEPLLAAAVRDGTILAFIDAATAPAGKKLPATGPIVPGAVMGAAAGAAGGTSASTPAVAPPASGTTGQPLPTRRRPKPIRLYPGDTYPVRPARPAALPPPPAQPPTPPLASLFPTAPGEPPVKLPMIEHGVHFLRSRLAFTPEEFRALGDGAGRVGFTVARATTLDAVERVQAAVVDAVRDGTTNREFRRAVRQAIDSSTLADHQVETLFRTNVGRAYAAGQLAVLDTPLVGDEFPYLEYSATHDARVRPEHLALERMGLNGTAVYRRDDPTIKRFFPPWAWNCRCIVIPLSLEDAARKGVKEARRWLETGQPPVTPEWVTPPPFDLPKGWTPVTTTIEPVLGA